MTQTKETEQEPEEETSTNERTCPFWMGGRAKCVLLEAYRDYSHCADIPCEVIYAGGVTVQKHPSESPRSLRDEP